MAEHLNHIVDKALSPFNAIGKPIPPTARQAGYKACKAMGLDSARAWECVNGMAEQLERDNPYAGQGIAMKFLDLTGTYRLMATLLTASLKDGE